MKRYIAVVLIVWIISVLLIFADSPKADNEYMLEVNRLHEGIMTLAEAEAIESVENIDISQLSIEQKRAFFVNTGSFIILPSEENNIFIRYTIKPQKQSRFPMLILFSLMPLAVLFALVKTQKDILKPLHVMSEIPEQLAKGHFQYNTPQYKNKVFHRFLWGLDMLRVKLDEQRNLNLGLEKERRTVVASLSHDIKTPLSSIRTYSIAIKDGVYDTQDEMHNALDIIIEKTIKIERLTDELMASSVNAIKKITVDAYGYYMSEIREAINKTAYNRLSLLKMEYNIDPIQNDILILADMDRLIEVCDNIIENAVKYGDLGRLSIFFDNEEQHILISFENTGGNIPEAEIKHVFNSFYRGSNVGKTQGHGLGLYIAKNIMRAMKGDIYAKNIENGVKIVLVVKQMS